MTRRTKSPARKALPSWLQHQEEQPHDALVEGIVLDLPWVKGGDGKVVARELRGQGPFKGEPEKLAASERAAYYEARKHQPWRRPPRSHRPYGLKWWDVVSAALTVAFTSSCEIDPHVTSTTPSSRHRQAPRPSTSSCGYPSLCSPAPSSLPSPLRRTEAAPVPREAAIPCQQLVGARVVLAGATGRQPRSP